MFEPPRLRHHRRGLAIVERRKDDQHRIRSEAPGLGHLERIDDEILGEDRPVEPAADGGNVLQPTRRNPARR